MNFNKNIKLVLVGLFLLVLVSIVFAQTVSFTPLIDTHEGNDNIVVSVGDHCGYDWGISGKNKCESGYVVSSPSSDGTYYTWTCSRLFDPSQCDSCHKTLDVSYCKSLIQNVLPVCGVNPNSCTAGSLILKTHYQPFSPGDNILWECIGGGNSNATKVKCQGRYPLNGACDGNNIINRCASGNFKDFDNNDTHFLWGCYRGTVNGVDRNCSKPKTLNAACGSDHNICTTGTLVNVADTTTELKWGCKVGTTTISCLKENPYVEGQCNYNVKDACLGGKFVDVKDTNRDYLWNCVGVGGATYVHNCSLIKPNLEACGSMLNSCINDRMDLVYLDNSDVSDDNSTHYKWACPAVRGDLSCSKKKTLDPLCGAEKNKCVGSSLVTGAANTSNQTENYWLCEQKNPSTGHTIKTVRCFIQIPYSNGVCGTDVNSCVKGTLGNYYRTYSGYYEWECEGTKFGPNANKPYYNKATCRVRPFDGVCGSEVNSCTKGTFTGSSDTSTTYYWQCESLNSQGKKAYCSRSKIDYSCTGVIPSNATICSGDNSGLSSSVANNVVSSCTSAKKCEYVCNSGYNLSNGVCVPIVNGSCGSEINDCVSGTFTDLTDTSALNKWSCVGSDGGTTASCSKAIPAKVDGVCSTTLNICTKGTFADVDDNATHGKWSCVGISGGTTANCVKVFVRNGSCGTELNSCVTGTLVDIVDGTTLAKWNCVGSGGGTTASCTKAIAAVNGVCGVDVNSCISGTFVDVSDSSTQFKWSCKGLGAGTISSCVKSKPVNDNFVCTGTPVVNSVICSGDDAGLTVNTAVKAVTTCSSVKCEYKCNNGYKVLNNSCVPLCEEGKLRINGAKIEFCKLDNGVYFWAVINKITSPINYE